MTLDTLKQAAQALRNTRNPHVLDLVAALEAMAEQKPAAHMYPSDLKRFQKTETIGHAYSVAVLCQEERSVPLYAAPIATPEHDAKVRDAALEEAAQLCERLGHGLDNGNRPYVRHHEVVQAMHRIRKLKSTGADYE